MRAGDIIDQMSLDSRVQGAQPNFRYRTSGTVAGAYPQDRIRIQPALGITALVLVVPIPLALLHQAGAIALLSSVFWLRVEMTAAVRHR